LKRPNSGSQLSGQNKIDENVILYACEVTKRSVESTQISLRFAKRFGQL